MIYYIFTHKEALMIKHFRIHGDNIVEWYTVNHAYHDIPSSL